MKMALALAVVAAMSGMMFAVAAPDAPKDTATQPAQTSFAGSFESEWGTVELTVDGNKVTGKYGKDGKIEAGLTSDGQTLEGTWSQGPTFKPPGDAGRVILMLTDGGAKFQGLWWKGQHGKGGTWVGKRVK